MIPPLPPDPPSASRISGGHRGKPATESDHAAGCGEFCAGVGGVLMVVPAVAYAKAEDGVHLAYVRMGSGSPVLIAGGPMLSCQQAVLANPHALTFLRALAEEHELILFDERGTGSSGGELADRTVDSDAADIEAIADAAGLGALGLLAAFIATPAALTWAAAHADRVRAVVLWCPLQHARDVLLSTQAQAIFELAQVDEELAFQVMVHTLAGWSSGPTGPWLTELYVQSYGLAGALHLDSVLTVGEDALAAITAETLVMHPARSRLIDVDLARRLTASLPNGRMMLVNAESIAPYAEDGEGVAQSMLDALRPGAGSRDWGDGPPADDRDPGLTTRERDVLRLIVRGDSSKEIAGNLQISVNTVDRHISNIYRKLGVRGRAQAAAVAVKRGIT